MKEIAVIILNWNGERHLREFLPSVVANSPPALADVIVADNGSTDGSVELLQKEFPSVKLLKFSKNLGFAEGYNRAIKETKYPFTLLLNSDVEVTPGYLNPLFDFMKEHPQAGGCQPKILSYKNKRKFEYAGAAGGFIDRHGFPYCRGRVFDTIEDDLGQYDTPIEVFWASGAALFVRTEVYLKAGCLDGSFFAHMEEIDLCWRMQLLGYQLWCIPSSIVCHLGGGSLPDENPLKTYLNFRNNLLMLYKNLPARKRSSRSLLDIRTATLLKRRLLDTLAFFKFVATLNLSNARAIIKAHRDFRKMKRASQPVVFAPGGSSPNFPNLLSDRPNILVEYYLRNHRLWNLIH